MRELLMPHCHSFERQPESCAEDAGFWRSIQLGLPGSVISFVAVKSGQPWSYISSAFEKEAIVAIKRKPPLLGREILWLWPLPCPTSLVVPASGTL
jgi:hypothetical protein